MKVLTLTPPLCRHCPHDARAHMRHIASGPAVFIFYFCRAEGCDCREWAEPFAVPAVAINDELINDELSSILKEERPVRSLLSVAAAAVICLFAAGCDVVPPSSPDMGVVTAITAGGLISIFVALTIWLLERLPLRPAPPAYLETVEIFWRERARGSSTFRNVEDVDDSDGFVTLWFSDDRVRSVNADLVAEVCSDRQVPMPGDEGRSVTRRLYPV